MAKILMISPEKCTGCRTCELACSFKHESEFNPARSRVSVLTRESAGISVPMMCMQCDDAACASVCPVGAISRDEVTGAMLVNETECIGCKMCIDACPFGNYGYGVLSRSIVKCDLCGGEPECAKNCPSGAIAYQEGTEANIGKKKAIASKLKEIFEEVGK